MNKTDIDLSNIEKCPNCGDTMGVDFECNPICICQTMVDES
jgi:hypothetical protein